MTLSNKQIEDFEAYARNPETWIQAARRSLAVAKYLSLRANDIDRISGDDFYEFSGCHYASFFYAAVAVENALRAVQIKQNPSVIKNGKLKIRELGFLSHELLKPIESILGNLDHKESRYLEKLELYYEAGRYNVPTNADVLYDEEKKTIARMSYPYEEEILEGLIDKLIKIHN